MYVWFNCRFFNINLWHGRSEESPLWVIYKWPFFHLIKLRHL
jgi:hypothetical protein